MTDHLRRSGNSWIADLPVDGHRKQLKRRTKTEAREAMALCIAGVQDKPAEKGLTLKAARQQTIITRWQNMPSLRVSCQSSQEALDYFGDVPLSTISALKVKDWRTYLLAKGNKPATVNRKVSCLSAILDTAVDLEQLAEMPRLPKRLPMDNTKDRVFSLEEELAFCETFRLLGHPDYADLVTFLVELGCRFSEAQRSITAHVNTHHKTISFLKTKNTRPRTNPCTEALWEIIERHLTPNSRGHLFPDLDYHQFQHQFDRVKGKLGLQDDKQLTIHCFRHTCASRMIRHVSLAEVMHWGGWMSLASVQRYLHLNVQSMGNSVRALEAERALQLNQ